QLLAAQRAGAMSRIDQGLVRQRQQLVAQRSIEMTAEIVSRPAQRRAQIGPTDVADEQGVAREDRLRLRRVAIEIEHQDRDRLDGVAGRLEHRQPNPSELEAVAIGHRRERILRLRLRPEMDLRAGSIAQLEVARNEVSVEMREE